ncbi:hypothetical protein T07_9671 [Trichinella nelsoni]|uniref:Secreted protein n=1 Tax=Trichinella nelsoni TaxID=6336 RepID=A0A0V0S441_9BILA|nr:hypothetical protein T07_9671 [Trichinella nelsoni]
MHVGQGSLNHLIAFLWVSFHVCIDNIYCEVLRTRQHKTHGSGDALALVCAVSSCSTGSDKHHGLQPGV